MSAFIAPKPPRSNVVPIRPGINVTETPAEIRARLAREDRELRIAFVIALAVIFATAALGMALLVLSERRHAVLHHHTAVQQRSPDAAD